MTITTSTELQKAHNKNQEVLRTEIWEISKKLEQVSDKEHPLVVLSGNKFVAEDLQQIIAYSQSPEQQTISTEIEPLLISIIRITENWESVERIHHLAMVRELTTVSYRSQKVEKNQRLFKRELTNFINNTKKVFALVSDYNTKHQSQQPQQPQSQHQQKQPQLDNQRVPPPGHLKLQREQETKNTNNSGSDLGIGMKAIERSNLLQAWAETL